MDEMYVFKQLVLDKDKISNLIQKKKSHTNKENNTITLLIMGHGRERYKENFKRVIDIDSNAYSEAFIYAVNQQDSKNTIRILSKAGKPKICAWDYAVCSETMSSQDIMIELSRFFFSDENQSNNTLTLMNSLSTYFKTIYPRIIEKISRNYRDSPEYKNPGSPDAEGYSQRYKEFNQVLQSLKENKFSDLKKLNHEKVFTIRPDSSEIVSHCEKYLFEIVEFRMTEESELTDFINEFMKIRDNLVKNYYEMNKKQLDEYIDSYKNVINKIYTLTISEYEKYLLGKFIFSLYFGNEILLSEIVEFFVILGINTINIIDNTCRIKDDNGKNVYSNTPETQEIESQERLHIRKQTSSSSKHGGKSNHCSKCKTHKSKIVKVKTRKNMY